MIRPALLAGLAALLASGSASAQTPRYEGFQIPNQSALERTAPRLAPADTTGAPPDDWFGRDKALHVGASFLLTLSGQYVLIEKADLSNERALPVSAGVALALGLAKEVADSQRTRHPLFSWRDLAADAAGVALASAVAAW